MTFSFGKPKDLSGVEGAIDWMQEHGAGRVDQGWSDVQGAAFAAIAASFGLTDADGDGKYEYDGKTQGPTGEEYNNLLEDALNTAANDLVVDQAEEAQTDVETLSEKADILTDAVVGQHQTDLASQTTFSSSQVDVNAALAPAVAEVAADIDRLATDLSGQIDFLLNDAEAAAKQAHDSVDEAKKAGYSVEEGEKAAADADQAVLDARPVAIDAAANANWLLGLPMIPPSPSPSPSP